MLSSSSGPLPPSTPPPELVDRGAAVAPVATPPKRPGQLPTLTELLASKKAKNPSPKVKERKASGPSVLAMAAGAVRDKERRVEEIGAKEVEWEKEKEREEQYKDHEAPFPDPYPPWDELDTNLNTNLYNATSTTKSLSSLAASDSDSGDDRERMNIDMDLTRSDGDGFNPPFVSTQAQGNGLAKEGSSGWMAYNSQFDVDGNVDAVSKFMEKDVSVGEDLDYDFDGWVREPSP